MTCDAWQASNADAYFAVTGHWLEKMPDGKMKQFSALLGFTLMNTAHDGVALGRALYKIIRRLGFGNKVSNLSHFLTIRCLCCLLPLRSAGLRATMLRITRRCFNTSADLSTHPPQSQERNTGTGGPLTFGASSNI